MSSTSPGFRVIPWLSSGINRGMEKAISAVDADCMSSPFRRHSIRSSLTVTSAAGLHAQPLAEFGLFEMLAFAKDLDVLQRDSARQVWSPRWPMRLRSSSHVVVLGLGGIGLRTAELAHAVGARVTGVRRTVGDVPPALDRVVSLEDLAEVLPGADILVTTLPGTPSTRGSWTPGGWHCCRRTPS